MSLPAAEQELLRLAALCASGLLDTPADERFDRITRLAAQFFDVPIALVSLVDEQRQWFKSRYGLEARETPRSQAFCAHAVQQRQLLMIEDALLDARFVANPLVTGGPLIRFYAGQPVFSSDGHALGTLCVIDTKPRRLDAAQIASLRDFAKLVEDEFDKFAVAHSALLGTRALSASQAKFEATFEQAAVGMAHVSLAGRMVHTNRKFRDIVGYGAEIEQLTFQQITHPDDLDSDLRLYHELLAGQRQSYAIEKRYLHRDGHPVWINLTVSLLRDEHGAPESFVSVIEDIQDKKEGQLALERLNASLESRVRERTAELERTVSELGGEVAQRTAVEAQLRLSEEHTRTILATSHEAFISIDQAGIVSNWNPAAERIFGWQAHEVIGKDLTRSIIPPEHHASHRHGMARFLATGQGAVINQRVTLPALTKSGATIPIEMTISAYRVNGAVYFGAFLQDISERRAAQAKLSQKQMLLDAVLASVDVGVVACDSAGTITLFNSAAERFHGVPATAVGAEGWGEAFDLFDADGVTRLDKQAIPLFRALSGEVVHDAGMTIVPQGQAPRFILASGQRLTGANGENLGAVVAMKDVTELKKMESQRALNESRLRAITENLPALIGHIDKDQKILFLNNHALRFYGKTRAELIGQDIFQIYSDEQYRDVQPYVEAAMAGTKASFESTMVVKGATRHFSAVYIPEQPGNEATGGFYAMAMDITERKNSELRQAESEERLRTITDNLPVLIAYVDKDEIYRFANAKHEEWFGVAPASMLGRRMAEVLDARDYAAGRPALQQNLAGLATRFETDYTHAGHTRTAEVVGMPHIKDGQVLGVYVMTTDISASKRHEQQLQALARCDPLTGLPNRRSYEERLHESALRSVRAGRCLGLIFLDIDFFKQINDTLGHAGGDEVLKEFGHRLRLAVRSTDAVCRFAGDEFTIILEGIHDASELHLVADKVLAAVRLPFFVGGAMRSVHTSMGGACHSAAQIDLGALAKQADQALYRAKENGRDGFYAFSAASD